MSRKFTVLMMVGLLVPATTMTQAAPKVYKKDTRYMAYARAVAEQNGIDPYIVFSIIRNESNWNAKVIGDQGRSYGLMQVQCATARALGFAGKCVELLDYRINVRYGVKYLKSRIEDYGLKNGIAAYNSGVPRFVRGKLKNIAYVNNVAVKALEYKYEHETSL